MDKVIRRQCSVQETSRQTCEHVIFRIGCTAAEVGNGNMAADSVFFGTELLEVCHGVCVAFKADMFVFTQIGISFPHNHDDVGSRLSVGGDGFLRQFVIECLVIAFRRFQAHDVDLMEEGINKAAGIVLIYLEIRVFHNRITVVQVFVVINQTVQSQRCQHHAYNADQTGRYRWTLFFAADEAENQYCNGSDEPKGNECQHIHRECLNDGQRFLDQCQVSGQQGFLSHGNLDFVADSKQDPYYLKQQGGKQQPSRNAVHQKYSQQCRQEVPQDHGGIGQQFKAYPHRMLGGDEKHQTHCNDSADEKRQNGFLPGKGGILLLKPVEKHRQNLLMFCFFSYVLNNSFTIWVLYGIFGKK